LIEEQLRLETNNNPIINLENTEFIQVTSYLSPLFGLQLPSSLKTIVGERFLWEGSCRTRPLGALPFIQGNFPFYSKSNFPDEHFNLRNRILGIIGEGECE